MFDFALSEFFVLTIVALIFLGPKELMIVFKTLGTWVRKLKDIQAAFYHHMEEAAKDTSKETSSSTQLKITQAQPHDTTQV